MKRFSVWMTEASPVCDVPKVTEYRATRIDKQSFTADNGRSKLVVRMAAGRRFFMDLEEALNYCGGFMERRRRSHLRCAEQLLADLQKPDLGIEIVKRGSAITLPVDAEEAEEAGIQRRRQARLAAGKCANCSRRPHKPGCTWCVVCLGRKAVAKAALDKLRKEMEMCPGCGEDVEEGYIYCKTCRKKRCDRKRRRHGSHAGSNGEAEVQPGVPG